MEVISKGSASGFGFRSGGGNGDSYGDGYGDGYGNINGNGDGSGYGTGYGNSLGIGTKGDNGNGCTIFNLQHNSDGFIDGTGKCY